MRKGMKKSRISFVFIILLVALLSGCSAKDKKSSPVIYVAWSNNQESYTFISTLRTIEAAGAEPVVLDQALSADLSYDKTGNLIDAEDEHGILTPENAKKVKMNSWQNSNVSEIMKDVDCVIFPGGSDICPTLYYDEQQWHGIEDDTDYSAERDVSDYILLSYCLEQDIPVLGICRGMQMLSVVSGADMIQDIPQWYEELGIEYTYDHRDLNKTEFMPHPVEVMSENSLLYKITGTNHLDGVPSWHHQALENVDNTRLVITAQAETDSRQIIEAVERPDKTFCIGVQFHPEVAVRKHLEKEDDAGLFLDYDTAMTFFHALLDAGMKESSISAS
jgi:putative glutamine amidotransferase